MIADKEAQAVLERAWEAHGGLHRWREVRRVDVRLSCGGPAFWAKGKGLSVGRPQKAQVWTNETRTRISPFANVDGTTGEYTPQRLVIEDGEGKAILTHDDPEVFRTMGRRLLPWTQSAMLYFIGYALHNYLTLPFSLASPGTKIESVDPVGEWPGIQVTYPEGLVTHCPVERFWFGADGRIARHDYNAEPVGPVATAAHYSSDYFEADGFSFAHTRRIKLRIASTPLHFVQVIWADIHEARVHG